MRDIRVATVQFQHFAGDKPYNLERVGHFVMEAKQRGVELIAFPEMCITGYWHVRKLSPPRPSLCVNSPLRLSHSMFCTGGMQYRYVLVSRVEMWLLHARSSSKLSRLASG